MKKGISLVSVIISIVVMTILATVVVTTGIDSFGSANVNAFATEILNIQTAVNEYYYRYNAYPVGTITAINVSSMTERELAQFNGETIVNNNITLKLVDLSLIGINDTKYGKQEYSTDVYAISEQTGRVYYLAGIEYEGVVYYTPTEYLYTAFNMQDVVDNNLLAPKDIKTYDVIFTPSSVAYTNKPIVVEIKLPSSAAVNKIIATNSKSVSTETVEGPYKVFKVNETSTDKTGNYTIEVNYTYNGVQKTSKYEVTNYDATQPTISVTEEKSNGLRKINITTNDTISGVKTIKYVEASAKEQAYFQTYGKTISTPQLILDSDSDYTLYVEDKAGNYNILEATEYAIYSEADNSLTFLRSGVEIVAGSTYSGKVATAVYTDFYSSSKWESYKENITSVMVEDRISPTSTAYWFDDFKKCTQMNLEKLDMSSVTDMNNMFENCGYNATDFKITGMDKWDVSNVKNMELAFGYMGYLATNFDIGNLSSWNTGLVENMKSMFVSAGLNADWSLDCSNWNVSNVKSYAAFNKDIATKVTPPNFI